MTATIGFNNYYSLAFRTRIFDAVDRGSGTMAETAALFGVNQSFPHPYLVNSSITRRVAPAGEEKSSNRNRRSGDLRHIDHRLVESGKSGPAISVGGAIDTQVFDARREISRPE